MPGDAYCSSSLRSNFWTLRASTDVEAAHEVYTKKCEICHAYDGGRKTEIGSGQYPRPPDLRSADVRPLAAAVDSGPTRRSGVDLALAIANLADSDVKQSHASQSS
jgi:hypothetical protein